MMRQKALGVRPHLRADDAVGSGLLKGDAVLLRKF